MKNAQIFKMIAASALTLYCGLSFAQDYSANETIIAIPANLTKSQTVKVISGLAAASDTSLTAIELDENGQVKKNAFVVEAKVEGAQRDDEQKTKSESLWKAGWGFFNVRFSNNTSISGGVGPIIQNKNLGRISLTGEVVGASHLDASAVNINDSSDGSGLGYTVTVDPLANKTNLPVRPTIGYRYYKLTGQDYDRETKTSNMTNYRKSGGVVFGIVFPVSSDVFDITVDFSRANIDQAITLVDNGIVLPTEVKSFKTNVISVGFSLHSPFN